MIVFSVLLIVLGTFVCTTASGMAEKQGIDLFFQSTDEEGNLVTTYTIAPDITKIELGLVGVDVNIVGGAQENKIELINFKINTYTYHETEDTLAISNDTNILSLLNLSGQGEQFHGLRHYKNLSNFKSGKQSVTLYVTDTTWIEKVTLEMTKGNVFATGVHAAAKYDISLNEGNIELSGVTNAVSFDLNIAAKGDVMIRSSSAAEITVGIEEGSFQFNSNAQSSMTTYALKTEEGTVNVNSVQFGNAYNVTSAAAESVITVNLVKGNIIVVDMEG